MESYIYGFICTITLIVLDYATGVIKAIVAKTLSSAIMRKGLVHKFAYLVVLFLAWFIELMSLHIDLGYTLPLFVPIVVGISAIEITSILENLCEINPELTNNRILNIFRKDN